MQSSFVGVTFASVLTLTGILACSAPEPSPSPTRQGGGTGANESNQRSEKNETTPTTSNIDCTSHAAVDDRPSCNTCAKSKCCKEIKACDDNADCAEIQKCLGDCKDDQICALTCLTVHPKGTEVLNDFASCVKGKCNAECPSTTPTEGDAGIDPF